MSVYFKGTGGASDAPPIQVVAISEVWGPYGRKKEFISNSYRNGINELATKFTNLDISKHFDRLSNVTIDIGVADDPRFAFNDDLKPEERERRISWGVLPTSYDNLLDCFIRFKADVVANADVGSEGSLESSTQRNQREIRRDLRRFVAALDCALQIAKPGCFQIRVGRSASELYNSPNSFNSFYYIIPKSMAIFGWPHLRELPADLVWKWFSGLAGVFRGKSNSPVSKAVCIFTRLFRQHFSSDEMQSIVWSMSALEALVGEGGRSAVGGLRQKLHLILPGVERTTFDFEKTIKEIYGLRSGLVHGDLKLASSFNNDDSSSGALSKEEAAEIFLGSVLLGLLQAAFIRKINKFEFEYFLR